MKYLSPTNLNKYYLSVTQTKLINFKTHIFYRNLKTKNLKLW